MSAEWDQMFPHEMPRGMPFVCIRDVCTTFCRAGDDLEQAIDDYASTYDFNGSDEPSECTAILYDAAGEAIMTKTFTIDPDEEDEQ